MFAGVVTCVASWHSFVLKSCCGTAIFEVVRRFVQMIIVIVSQRCSQIGEAQSLSLWLCRLWAVKSVCFVGLFSATLEICGVLERHV
jgi:hypothetical protein